MTPPEADAADPAAKATVVPGAELPSESVPTVVENVWPDGAAMAYASEADPPPIDRLPAAPNAPEFVMRNLPAEIAIGPENVLAPPRVSVAAPSLFIPAD